MIDVNRARAQFPSFGLDDGGRAPAFLDNPAGTQVPRTVIDAVSSYFATANANTQGSFLTSKRTDETIAGARAAMADLLGASDPHCIVFGPNMTTLTFAFSRSIARDLGPGDEIVVTSLDHDANIAPWLAVAEDTGATVRWARINPADGTLDMESLRAAITPRTRVVAATYCSNALGTITDVREITRLGHAVGALVWIDAVQYAPHGPIDVEALGCDFLACSAYKFFGPHIGIVYGKKEHLDRLRPYKVRPSKDEAPYRWETGTQAHELLAGVTAAVDYLASLGAASARSRRARLQDAMKEIVGYEKTLAAHLLSGLGTIDGVRVYGLTDPGRLSERAATTAMTLDGFTPDEVAAHLGASGVYVWSGNYYALAVMEALGLQERGGAVRIGPVHYNTTEEIDRALGGLRALAATRARSTAGVGS